MSFYNIIFGILFLGACRQLMLLSATSDSEHVWRAATLLVLIINDVVNTTYIIEGRDPETYTVFQKLIDLANFFLLSIALIALQPNDNPFQVPAPRALVDVVQPWVFWSMMIAYWLLVILWNWFAGLYSASGYPAWLQKLSFLLWLPFLFMVFVVRFEQPAGRATEVGEVIAFLVPTLYLVICKPIAELQRRSRIAQGNRSAGASGD